MLQPETIARAAIENNIEIPVYIDLNVGMNRTGIFPGDQAIKLYEDCSNIKGIHIKGLHVYDGHIRTRDIQQRQLSVTRLLNPLKQCGKSWLSKGFPRRLLSQEVHQLFLFMQKEKI